MVVCVKIKNMFTYYFAGHLNDKSMLKTNEKPKNKIQDIELKKECKI